MLDTIVLTLNSNMYTILDKDKFSPSAKVLDNPSNNFGSKGYIKCVQNPSSVEQKAGNYKPRLSVTKRFVGFGQMDISMKIEFSVPKLLFGNNFDELVDSDFDQIITKLVSSLKEMGVLVFSKVLMSAPISSIHYSKNIPLTDYTTPYTYIRQLSKVSYNGIMDFSQTDYFNGGSGIKTHSNSFELAFYDKVRDLQRSKISPKRSFESNSRLQLNLFEDIKKTNPFEVLRMEVRLNSRAKIKQILKNCQLEIEPTFSQLFSQLVSQKVLNFYIDQTEKGYPQLLKRPWNGPEKFLFDFLNSHPEKSFGTALKYTGMRGLLETMSLQELKQVMKNHSPNFWYSIQKDMKTIKPSVDTDVFRLLRATIDDYKPLRLVDFIG